MVTMEKNCLTCNKIFYKQLSDSKKYWAIKRYCSIICSGTNFKKGHKPSSKNIEYLKSRTGDKSNSWRGGRSITAQGYMRVRIDRSYILEHRYVMEQHLGYKLLPDEHVHHLNGNKTDNRLENLTIIDRKEHGLAHARQRWHGEQVDHLHGINKSLQQ